MEGVGRTDKAGIRVGSSFVLAAEGDQLEGDQKFPEFVDAASPERVDVFLLTPFPGTVLFDKLDQEGKILSKNWDNYNAKHVNCLLADSEKEELIEKFSYIGSRIYSWRSILKRTLCDRYWGLFDRVVLFFTQARRRRIFRDIARRMS